jgi:hypothetical protein
VEFSCLGGIVFPNNINILTIEKRASPNPILALNFIGLEAGIVGSLKKSSVFEGSLYFNLS